MDKAVMRAVSAAARDLYMELQTEPGRSHNTRAFPSGRTEDQCFELVKAAMPEIVRACARRTQLTHVGYPSAD